MDENYIIVIVLIVIMVICFSISKINKPNNHTIIIGSGLAGLSATITILEKGGKVILIEKQSSLGGNSAKASSGINGTVTKQQKYKQVEDSIEKFYKDTVKSSSRDNEPYFTLINQLVNKSGSAITWLEKRGVNLNDIAILGGHSESRTHRPDTNVLAGIEIISKLVKHLDNFKSNLTIMKNTTVIRILKDNNDILGVEYESENNGNKKLYASSVILTTGGYANDHSKLSLLHKHRPDLKSLPTTNSNATTGDGIKLGMLLGALTRDMEEIQVHPTGFIDDADPTNKTKTLCGEVMRGVGGILLNSKGERFCNELGTRQYVVDKMNKFTNKTFYIVLNDKAVENVKSHLNHYMSNNLIKKIGIGIDLSNKLGFSKTKLETTFKKYNDSVNTKKDIFGKTIFPVSFSMKDTFYVGKITPVLHYCMGGLQINKDCQVLTEQGVLNNLYAAGEVTSGIHGANRLGGNSLLECNIYGRIAGEQALKKLHLIPKLPISFSLFSGISNWISSLNPTKLGKFEEYTLEEVSSHNTEADAWMVIDHNVYDVTKYINVHPGGRDAIIRYAGKDATKEFYQIHEKYMLDDLKPIGIVNKN